MALRNSAQIKMMMLSCKTPYSLSLFDLTKSIVGGEVEASLMGKENSEVEEDLM